MYAHTDRRLSGGAPGCLWHACICCLTRPAHHNNVPPQPCPATYPAPSTCTGQAKLKQEDGVSTCRHCWTAACWPRLRCAAGALLCIPADAHGGCRLLGDTSRWYLQPGVVSAWLYVVICDDHEEWQVGVISALALSCLQQHRASTSIITLPLTLVVLPACQRAPTESLSTPCCCFGTIFLLCCHYCIRVCVSSYTVPHAPDLFARSNGAKFASDSTTDKFESPVSCLDWCVANGAPADDFYFWHRVNRAW